MDPEQVTNVCGWWHERRVLPATSVDVERGFSQGRIVLLHLCSHLSVQSTRALICLGVWSRLGYVNNSDIKAVVVLPEIPAHEKEERLTVGWDSILE
ncbi:hypothetical protein B0H34DRAFT_305249 [Crassisporium funariophilum]|nr:hypothetical protein B0H34DRAFT_305249 [Crassisporium funariophilum]